MNKRFNAQGSKFKVQSHRLIVSSSFIAWASNGKLQQTRENLRNLDLDFNYLKNELLIYFSKTLADSDKEKFIKDVESKETADIIRKEIEEGQKLEIDATPTMIINGEMVVGVKPYYKLTEILKNHGAKK